MNDCLSSKDFTICIISFQHFSLLARQCVVKLWQKPFVKKKKKKNTATYRCSFLPFVHGISSDVGGGHGVAAPHKTHRHQSAESLPDLVGITCRWAHTHTQNGRGDFNLAGRQGVDASQSQRLRFSVTWLQRRFFYVVTLPRLLDLQKRRNKP